jgi:hypothetical protein
MMHKGGPNPLSRRDWIASLSGGLGLLGLAGMLSQEQLRAEADSGVPKFPNFPAKAKHNIVLFMVGGPSQLDMFDPKPALGRSPHRAHYRRSAALAVRV